ncbi:MAG: hypothetical protein K2X39_05940, partial [Silvanigrellaceae bacterium]|nr:hypothetical protein [Silvanigrellaceae bacterium]
LGYGGGYYDRFLQEMQGHVTSIFCLPSKDFLVLDLPTEPWDEKVTYVVTLDKG